MVNCPGDDDFNKKLRKGNFEFDVVVLLAFVLLVVILFNEATLAPPDIDELVVLLFVDIIVPTKSGVTATGRVAWILVD